MSVQKSDNRIFSGFQFDELKDSLEELLRPMFEYDEPIFDDNSQQRIVVIGSGIGGMSAGSLFAKNGHLVTVLEQNPDHIGGHGRTLTIEGLRFCMGPQYVWNFGEGMLGSRFMEYVGIKEENPFLPMAEDGFERFFVGQKRHTNYLFADVKVPKGFERFCKLLVSLFPEEKENIVRLFADMDEIYSTYRAALDDIVMSESRLLLATKLLLSDDLPFATKLKFGTTSYITLKAFFDQYNLSNLVRRLLYGHGGIFAENENAMSAIAYIAATGNYHSGAWYPQKGFHHFFNSMSKVIEQNGGQVCKGMKVVELKTEDSKVTKVVTDSGEEFECDYVFSNISPRLTAGLLTNVDVSFDYAPAHSIPTCCIGLRKGLPGIQEMRGSNYWWQDGMPVDYEKPDVLDKPKMLFIASPTANGFGCAKGVDRDGLVVFCPGNYVQERSIHSRGPNAVEEFKSRLADDIVHTIDENVFPGIKEHVLFTHVLTSITIERQTLGEMGNAYGRRLSAEEVMKGPILDNGMPENLFNVSGTKNDAGIASGIFGSLRLFAKLTGKEV